MSEDLVFEEGKLYISGGVKPRPWHCTRGHSGGVRELFPGKEEAPGMLITTEDDKVHGPFCFTCLAELCEQHLGKVSWESQ